MADFHFDVSPIMDRVSVDLPEGMTEIPATIRSSVLREVADRVRDTIVASWPVDTGLSLAGFRTEPEGVSWSVDNPVDYTSFVHDGLVERLANDGLRNSVSFAEKLIRDRLRTMTAAPGTRPVVSIDAQRKQRKVPAQVVQALRDAGAAPEPVIDLYERGFIGEALSLLTSTLEAAASSQATVVAAAEQLQRQGRITQRILALVRSGALQQAISELTRNGRVEEARILAGAR